MTEVIIGGKMIRDGSIRTSKCSSSGGKQKRIISNKGGKKVCYMVQKNGRGARKYLKGGKSNSSLNS